MKALTVFLLAFLFTSCAGYDFKKRRVDVAPFEGAPGIRQTLDALDDVAEKKAAREKAEREAEEKKLKSQAMSNGSL